MDPIGFCFRRVPSGYKIFSRFQKGLLKVRILEVFTPFLKHNKMGRISNGPHWVLLSQSPFGGYSIWRTSFKKYDINANKRKPVRKLA